MGKTKVTTHDSTEDLIPTEGWLAEYVKFSRGLEACPRFRFFTACCILGAAINNRVWIQRGDEGLLPRLHPNLWILLLAPPGQGHKTSTINMGVNCLTQACPSCRLLADKLTPESLVKALSAPIGAEESIRIGPRDATGLIKAPELSVFFGRQQYNVGLVSLITDLYDYREEWSSETIMRGKNVLKNVCISLSGASTPDWLQTMLPQDAFTGGFMSRFVIVEQPTTYFKRKAFPTKAPEDDWGAVVRGLSIISSLKGPMEWSKESKENYIIFYEKLVPTGDIQRDAYQEREAEQILKLGMLLALSQGRLTLDGEDITLAKKLLESLMVETAPRIERLTTHPRMALIQEIQDLLKRHGPMTEQQILKTVVRGLAGGEMQFKETIRLLRMADIVNVEGDIFKNPTLSLKEK